MLKGKGKVYIHDHKVSIQGFRKVACDSQFPFKHKQRVEVVIIPELKELRIRGVENE